MTGVMQKNVKTPRDATGKSNLQVRPDAVRWVVRLDAFLSFNDRQVLVCAGKVSHKQAVFHAQGEYEQFADQRRAAKEVEGAEYAVRMLGTRSTDEKSLGELGQIAKRLTKKKGGRDAS
jgi:hypothetical protein